MESVVGWAIAGGGLAAVWVAATAWQAWSSGRKAKQDRLDDLQFWRHDDGDGITRDLHFPSMQMLHVNHQPRRERYFHVRRAGDGSWEAQLTPESYSMEIRMLRDRIARANYIKPTEYRRALKATKAAKHKWTPITEAPEIETAYQRFIHAQSVQTVDVVSKWEQWEAEAHDRERRTFLPPKEAEPDQIADAADDEPEDPQQVELDLLQFWEHYESHELASGSHEVHFPTMRMRYEFSAPGADTSRYYHVRRRADGTWERRFTAASYDMEAESREAERGIPGRSLLEPMAEPGEWQPLENPALETAYQRFIHAQGVRAIDPRWDDEERKAHEKERERLTREKRNDDLDSTPVRDDPHASAPKTAVDKSRESP